MAIHRDDIDLVRWFLNHSASPNLRPNSYMSKTPLSQAVIYSSIDIVRLLVSRGARVDEGNLLHAISWSDRPGRDDVLAYILSEGAPLNKLKHEHDPRQFAIEKLRWGVGTPLHDAVGRRRKWIVVTLLAWGADKAIRDTKGRTPEELGREIGATEVLEVF